MFLAWVHLAVRHAQARGRRVTGSPRAAVLWWFAPVACFIVPFARVRQLAPEVSTRAWQACWAASFIIAVAQAQAARDPSPAMRVLTYTLLVLGYAASVASSLLGARAVKLITDSLTPASERPGPHADAS